MQLRYQYRLNPTPGQQAALARAFGCARVVFNDAIAAREAARRDGQPYPKDAELSTALTAVKQTPERAWLTEVSSVVLQQALADANTAYRNFFASLAGKRKGTKLGAPRFRSRRACSRAAIASLNTTRAHPNARASAACCPGVGLRRYWYRSCTNPNLATGSDRFRREPSPRIDGRDHAGRVHGLRGRTGRVQRRKQSRPPARERPTDGRRVETGEHPSQVCRRGGCGRSSPSWSGTTGGRNDCGRVPTSPARSAVHHCRCCGSTSSSRTARSRARSALGGPPACAFTSAVNDGALAVLPGDVAYVDTVDR